MLISAGWSSFFVLMSYSKWVRGRRNPSLPITYQPDGWDEPSFNSALSDCALLQISELYTMTFLVLLAVSRARTCVSGGARRLRFDPKVAAQLNRSKAVSAGPIVSPAQAKSPRKRHVSTKP